MVVNVSIVHTLRNIFDCWPRSQSSLTLTQFLTQWKKRQNNPSLTNSLCVISMSNVNTRVHLLTTYSALPFFEVLIFWDYSDRINRHYRNLHGGPNYLLASQLITRSDCRLAFVAAVCLFVCPHHNSKRMIPKCSNYGIYPRITDMVMGSKVKVTGSINAFFTVQGITKMIPKCSNLVYGMTFGYRTSGMVLVWKVKGQA